MRVTYERQGYPNPQAVTGIKLLALFLSVIILIIYVASGFQYDIFINTLVLILIVSLVSLLMPVMVVSATTRLRRGLKITDMIAHGVMAMFAVLAASLFLDRVTRFSEAVRYSHRTGQSFFTLYGQNMNGEALAAGILMVFLSLIHAIVVVTIWRKV